MDGFLRAANFLWDEVRSALAFCLRWYGRRWLMVTGGLFIAFLTVWLIHPLDAVLQTKLEGSGKAPWAVLLSYLGDFVGFNLTVFAVLVFLAWRKHSRALFRIAVASLLCATLSGIAANALRIATGRPRPFLGVEDGLYGIRLNTDMQSLPSAHAATAFGGALPVLMTKPVPGFVLTVASCGVAAARLQLRRHHLTDVLVSLLLAGLVALPLASWTKDVEPPQESSVAQNRAPPDES
jgi:membrane-associated phospholipid phosphatase